MLLSPLALTSLSQFPPSCNFSKTQARYTGKPSRESSVTLPAQRLMHSHMEMSAMILSDSQMQTAHHKNTTMQYLVSHSLSTAPQFCGPHANKNSSHYPPLKPNTSLQLMWQRNVSGSAD